MSSFFEKNNVDKQDFLIAMSTIFFFGILIWYVLTGMDTNTPDTLQVLSDTNTINNSNIITFKSKLQDPKCLEMLAQEEDNIDWEQVLVLPDSTAENIAEMHDNENKAISNIVDTIITYTQKNTTLNTTQDSTSTSIVNVNEMETKDTIVPFAKTEIDTLSQSEEEISLDEQKDITNRTNNDNIVQNEAKEQTNDVNEIETPSLDEIKGCAVILGSFGNPDNAKKLVKRLKKDGYVVYKTWTRGLRTLGVRTNCDDTEKRRLLKEVHQQYTSKAWLLRSKKK